LELFPGHYRVCRARLTFQLANLSKNGNFLCTKEATLYHVPVMFGCAWNSDEYLKYRMKSGCGRFGQSIAMTRHLITGEIPRDFLAGQGQLRRESKNQSPVLVLESITSHVSPAGISILIDSIFSLVIFSPLGGWFPVTPAR
jgi:hypothetical protein